MERMAKSRLRYRRRYYLESENLIARHQSGFRTGHSTMDALARLESDVRKTFIQDDDNLVEIGRIYCEVINRL